MPSLNKVTLMGHLGKDPEMRFTPNGNAVTSFSLATSSYRKTEEGSKQETEWHSIVTWNKVAELCNQYLHKGSLVYVEGRIKTRTWEKDGQKHYKTEILASNVLFLDKKTGAEAIPDGEGEVPF